MNIDDDFSCDISTGWLCKPEKQAGRDGTALLMLSALWLCDALWSVASTFGYL